MKKHDIGKSKHGPHWKGGTTISKAGYPMTFTPEHPRTSSSGYVSDHILQAEAALGKHLPPGAVVHHANGSRNSGPLVICQDNSYHKLLHQRMRALEISGHANWRSCVFCKQYDDPDNLYINGKNARHRECWKKHYAKNREHLNELQRIRRAKSK